MPRKNNYCLFSWLAFMHTEMKCESGKTEGLRSKKRRVDALWESAHLVWNAKVRWLCWEKAESKTPSFG